MVLPLTPAKAKAQRADEHLEDLERVVGWFVNRDPYDVLPEIEAETGDKVYRIYIKERVPQTIPLIAGDVVHNARAALDLIYCALVGANRKAIAESDHFPASRSAQKFNTRVREIRSRIGDDAAKVIQMIEPYNGGNGHAIWCLHALDVVDKHRLLLTTAFDITHIVGPNYHQLDSGIWTTLRFPEWSGLPIKDGDEVARIAFHPELEGYDKPKFRFDIALYESEIVKPQPIIELLSSLLQETNRVIDSLSPLV